MSEPLPNSDRAVIFDPGETVEVLHRLLDITAEKFTFLRPDTPSFLVPLGVRWIPAQCELVLIIVNNFTGEGNRILYRPERGIHSVLRPVEMSPIPSLPEAIEELAAHCGAGRFWGRLDNDGPRYYHYDQGDWVYQLRSAYKDLVREAQDKWDFKGSKPTSVQCWMTGIVAVLPEEDPPAVPAEVKEF